MENKVKDEIVGTSNVLAVDTIDKEAVKNRLQLLDGMGLAIKSALKEGIVNDYAIIPGCGNKPSLLQPGARKIVQMFGLKTQFEMISSTNERCVMKCVLSTPNNEVISESYGACSLNEPGKKSYSENNLIKFAQKRAMVGAVLQVSNLSKIFTQDIEDTYAEVDRKEVVSTLKTLAQRHNINPKVILNNDGIKNEKQMLTKEYLKTLKERL